MGVRYITVKYFHYFLTLIGVFLLVVGFYSWWQDGFIVPWGKLFDGFISQSGHAPRRSGSPISGYWFLIPLGIGIIFYSVTELSLNKRDDDKNI